MYLGGERERKRESINLKERKGVHERGGSEEGKGR